MQANNVNQALQRVSSDEIKRNYTQITGREALERLLAGETVYSAEWAESWRLVDGAVSYRDCESDDNWEPSNIELRAFLDTEDGDWYVAPPFDARKEMLARPGEWVAKYTEDGLTRYVGFDRNNMGAVESISLEKCASYNPDSSVFIMYADDIDRAIPLDDADLAKLASLSKEGE